MTKITYYQNGLLNSQSEILEKIEKNIVSLGNINFDIPDGISDEVLSNFSNIVIEFSKNFENIKKNIKLADSNYKNLNEKISNDIKCVNEIMILERTPIV